MKWRGRRGSGNVVDIRRGGAAKAAGGLGIGGLLIVLVGMFLGIDLSGVAQFFGGGGGAPAPGASRDGGAIDDEIKQFVSVVLKDTEDTWNEVFAGSGVDYQEPKLVLFSGAVNSACGRATSAVGPFYCPGDRQVYLDTAFFNELRTKFGAAGDFAQAYVIAHEVGHHVQTLIGVSNRVQQMKARASQTEANDIQVRMELQADCFAGIWARYADEKKGVVERGDIQEALRAAAAVGDDTIQRRTRGYVVPDSFTHGSADQRQRWFIKGYKSGKATVCDTFSTNRL